MARGKLTPEEIKILSKSPYVISADDTRVVYSNEFKFLFMEKYQQGMKPRQIFAEAGFDVDILGAKRIERSAARWRESFAAGTLGKYHDHTVRHKQTVETQSKLEKKDIVISKLKLKNNENIQKKNSAISKLKVKKNAETRKTDAVKDQLRQQRKINTEKLENVSSAYKKRLKKNNEKSSKQKDMLEAKYQKKLENKQAEIELLKAQVEALKKAGKIGRRRCERRVFGKIDLCEIIEEISHANTNLSVKHLCAALDVARSTYYYYLANKDARMEREEHDLADFYVIQDAFNHIKYARKGSRSLHDVLVSDYYTIFNRKKIQRLMRKFNLVCPIKAKNPYKGIWKATKEDRVAPNLVQRNFRTGKPRKILLTDITYIKYDVDKFAYLSAIIDAQTNEPLAYKLSNNLKMDFVIETLEQLDLSDFSTDTIIHSDQGVHYTSKRFRDKLTAYGFKQSMSARGLCLDNAPMESFFGHMKREAKFDSNLSFDELKCKIDDYMNYYQFSRIQRRLNKMTPYEYSQHLMLLSA